MIVVKTIQDLQNKLAKFRTFGSIGFVPTMGALHKGHISLVDKATVENKTVVVSIFVNPTQFNDSKDLDRYPRTMGNDLELLRSTECQVVFVPDVKEIYPKPDTRNFQFGELETVMEGKHRPGHFNGVAQVVSKLFEMVQPDNAYFGLKDFQQLAIIKNMTKQLALSVKIVSCPVIREENGLAMSSRNELLTSEQRANAGIIFETLLKVKEQIGQKSVEQLKDWATKNINKNPSLTVEYFEIVDDERLQPVINWDSEGKKVGCVAAYCGKIRLIDNIILNDIASHAN